MKKITKLLGGGVALAALFLASCNGAVTPISSDTVVDLDTPAIYAKAYPGVNIVSWEPVSAASGYDIYRYENDNLSNKEEKLAYTFAQGKYTFEDFKIQNDVKYTYKIMAKGNLRSVVTKDSKLGSVTVTGIVPPKDVSALNLAAYEGGYNGKDAKELSDDEKNNKLLTAEKTKIYFNKGQFNVSFPAKAYLKYSVLLSEGDEYAITKVEPGVTTGNTVTTVNNNSVISLDSLSTYKSGKHAIYIKVASKNTDFHNYELIRVGEVENKLLNLDWMNDGTGTWKAWNEACGISNYYIDNMTTARIKFKAPILSSTKSAAPASYIKLYRELDGNPGLIAVDAAIKSYTETDGTVYYYADVANDNNYRYVVVVTDGNGAFASEIASTTVYTWKNLASGVSASGSPITLDNDGKANDVKWTINLADTNRTIKGVYSLVWNSNAGSPVVTDFDKTKALTAKLNYNNTNSKEYVVYEKNLADGKAYLLVEFSEPNKTDNYVISPNPVTVSNTVAPELKGIPGVTITDGNTNSTAIAATALDTDKKSNDIKWKVTLPNTYTTFKAYLLTRDKSGTPDIAEFDTTTALPAVAESQTNLTTYYIYTKDIAAEKYASLLVIASRTGYVDSYTVKTASQISANPSFTNGVTLSISNAYDNSTTMATTTAESTWKKNDLIINVSELIYETSDSIANYTYELFRTTSTVATDLTNNTITFKYNTADWKSLGKLTMNKSAAYNAAATSNTYVAVYKDTDLADGVYAYKVIKSNGVESASTAITYKKITANVDINGIKFTPANVTASWKAVTGTTGVAKNDIEVEFQKNNTVNTNVTDAASGYVINKVDETAEEGVTYSLWRTTLEKDQTETVYTKVGDFNAGSGTNGTYTKWTKDAAGNWTSASANYVDYLTYKYTDKELSTGKSYKYIVVASKTGFDSKYSSATSTVVGKN